MGITAARATLAGLIESGNICSSKGQTDEAKGETADVILNEVEVIENRYAGPRVTTR